jgi:tRNA U55 pseudouridine synthase TruB
MALRAVDGVRVDAGGCRVEATVHVHKGTYVRSLAVELGRRLGIPAHLAMLRRTRSGLARLDDPRVLRPVALRLPPLAPGAPPGPPRYRLTLREPTDLTGAGDTGRGEDGEQLRRQLVPVVELLGLPTLGVSEELQARLRQGQRIPVSALGWQPREGDRAVVLGADVGGPLTIVEARPNPRGAGADPRGPAFPPELARDPLVAQPAWTLQP